MKSRHTRLLVLAVAVAVAAGWAGTASAPASVTATTKVRMVLGFQWQPQWMPLLYGQKKGYFAKQKLSVSIQPTSGGLQATQLQAAGKADFAFTDLNTYITARANGQTKSKIVYVWLPQPTLGFVSMKPLPDPEDLAGKTFATLPTSNGDTIIQELMKDNGVPASSLTTKKLDFSVLYAALFQGSIDAAEVRDPGSWRSLVDIAAKQNRQIFMTRMADWGLKSYGYVLTATDAMIAKHPDLVRRVVAAVGQSEHNARNQLTGTQVVQLLSSVTQVSDAKASALDWQDWRTYSAGSGPIDPFVIQSEIGLQLRIGAIHKKPKLSTLYTNKFVPKLS